MSKVAIKGASTGTGTFTIESPATNTDRTLVLPDNAGTVLTSASDLAAANLTGNVAAARITDALNAGGSAPIYACRAWVNFNATGTVAIRASGNVSSVTKNSTGDYTINFDEAMPDANYSLVGTGTARGGGGTASVTQAIGYGSSSTNTVASTYSTTSARFVMQRSTGALLDVDIISVQVFR